MICVCVCTYKRPELLRRLLLKLNDQETNGQFDYSMVVVDNDRLESARKTVEAFGRESKVSVSYHVEPEQNIALARNKAIANAAGDFVCLIDDDEFPDQRWLNFLYNSIVQFNADGILGPVLPHFETPPPPWVLKGRFFERPSHATGHVLDWRNTRTGNALLRISLFNGNQPWFDPAFGSGGEDREFFRRQIERGKTFVWCNEAAVFETVPPRRWNRAVLMKRALLRGKMALNSTGPKSVEIAKSLTAATIYTAGLPFFAMMGHHVFMKFLIKDCDHIGKLLAFLGIDVVKEKYVDG